MKLYNFVKVTVSFHVSRFFYVEHFHVKQFPLTLVLFIITQSVFFIFQEIRVSSKYQYRGVKFAGNGGDRETNNLSSPFMDGRTMLVLGIL